jgi:hypothetical protein
MSIFGSCCLFCGLYIKPWSRAKHEVWHADQVVHITTLLCNMCFAEHGKMHESCARFPVCRCVCNAFVVGDDS